MDALSNHETFDSRMSILERTPAIVQPTYQGQRTIVLIPSVNVGSMNLRFFPGVQFYEERYLYFLTFLKQPRTRLVAVLSEGVEQILLDYFLDHVRKAIGITKEEIQKRFTLILIPTRNGKTLTANILSSQTVLRKIQRAILNPRYAFIEFWRVTHDEYRLVKKLHVPYYGLQPRSFFINTKSGAREIFRRSGLHIACGYENLFSLKEAHDALQRLLTESDAKHFLLKINNEGSGVGILKLDRRHCALPFSQFRKQLSLPKGQSRTFFERYFKEEGGVVEEFIDWPISISPSVQFEIRPNGRIVHCATHDQLLDGMDYLGTSFPASSGYRRAIVRVGHRVAKEIKKVGGRGFIAMDLLVTKKRASDAWSVWGIEINARKGGTNHTHMWVKYLTGSTYNIKRGTLESRTGDIYYKASERFIYAQWLKKVSPARLLQTIQKAGLDFDHVKQRGVFVHLLSPLRHFGKFGVTIIGHSPAEVNRYWKKLDRVIHTLGE